VSPFLGVFSPSKFLIRQKSEKRFYFVKISFLYTRFYVNGMLTIFKSMLYDIKCIAKMDIVM